MGAALLGLIALYLAVVSVWAKKSPESLAALIGRPADDAYGHPLLIVLLALLIANISVATLTRVRLDLLGAGAWLSHVGVVILAAGATWYAAGAVKGYCVFMRDGAGWPAVKEFYEDDTHALTIYPDEPTEPPKVVELPIRDNGRFEQPQNFPVTGGDDGPQITVTGYYRNVVIESAYQVPMVELEIAAEGLEQKLLLSPAIPSRRVASTEEYIITYEPDAPPERLEELLDPEHSEPLTAAGHDVIRILSGAEVGPNIVLIRPDNTRWHAALEPGRAVEVPLTRRKITVTPLRFRNRAELMERARRPRNSSEARRAFPSALRVELRLGEWRQTRYLPLAAACGRQWAEPAELPDGRELSICYCRRPRPLRGKIELLGAEFQTQPGSTVPKDYRCELRIGRDGDERDETLSLNNPVMLGPYQLSQGSWQRDENGRPRTIVLGVRSRPGLPVIWTGCSMIVAGLLWAFYVKPIVLRRRRAAE